MEPGNKKDAAKLDKQTRIRNELKKIHAQRSEIVRAFIAKYDCQPDECEQVVVTHNDGIRFYIRKRVMD